MKIVCIAGPTASGKTERALKEATARGGEIISVDSRQVYRMLDIGTEKIAREEMRGIPHHLIDIRDPKETYSAGDFVHDASRLIKEISARGKLPILAGGTHFYFDALLHGLPEIPNSPELRAKFEKLTDAELLAQIQEKDPERAAELDPHNRRRLIRALEMIECAGKVPRRAPKVTYEIEWIIIDSHQDELKKRIVVRLESAFARGLVDEVKRVCEYVGDARLNEFGLEYKIAGEYLRGERTHVSLLPTLSSKLWQFARRQKAWLRKLRSEQGIQNRVESA